MEHFSQKIEKWQTKQIYEAINKLPTSAVDILQTCSNWLKIGGISIEERAIIHKTIKAICASSFLLNFVNFEEGDMICRFVIGAKL